MVVREKANVQFLRKKNHQQIEFIFKVNRLITVQLSFFKVDYDLD